MSNFKSTTQILKLCILAFIFTFSIPSAFAQTSDIGYSRISPASPLYFLKAARESLEVKLAKTPLEKLALHLDFSYRRLREARTLIFQREDLVQPTLERYLSEVNSLPREHQEKDELGLRIKAALNDQIKTVGQMYSQTMDTEAKRTLRSVMNRLIQRADIDESLKLPVCLLFAREASSSALNETEGAVLTGRAGQCFKQGS